MKRIRYLIILLLFTSSISIAQKDLSPRIDGLFTNWNSKGTPGCAIGILKDNKIIFEKSYGLANLETNTPISIDSRFAIGSLTKQFTAYCTAILIHQNKMTLDDDIRLYLPEFPYTKDTIRIRHLIYHTSGLNDFSNLIKICGYTYDDVINEQMIKEIIYSCYETNYKPGEKFEYCNSGYFLLAEIVEKVSGQRIDEFARKNIFIPLGMKNTFYYFNPDPIDSNISVSYS